MVKDSTDQLPVIVPITAQLPVVPISPAASFAATPQPATVRRQNHRPPRTRTPQARTPQARTSQARNSSKTKRRWGVPLLLGALIMALALTVTGTLNGWFAPFLAASSAGASSLLAVPAVNGQSPEEATELLENQGFKVGGHSRVSSNSVKSGKVAGTEPAVGSLLGKGAVVSLLVSTGPALTEVPALKGLTLEAAQQMLAQAGLAIGQPSAQNSSLPAGSILESSPPGGSRVPRGSKVSLLLASGWTVVPGALVGGTVDQAGEILKAAGLVVQEKFEASSAAAGTVLGLSPAEASPVAVGGTVVLLIARPSVPSPSPSTVWVTAKPSSTDDAGKPPSSPSPGPSPSLGPDEPPGDR
ncbi:PASTA domain-containing protein [Psychromicrobium sp. YIM B11713]|uniref:PASTA domain-containing protein n=1 Tax=Psychromicrobium sp. YIM B11713 TaxID=3145233 RepID=UPI00374F5F34